MRRTIIAAAAIASLAGIAYAQTPAQQPAPIVQGATGVTVGGMPAARAGDATGNGGQVVEGSSNVVIGGKPAARVGDRTNCGVVVQGATNVYVNGKPLARTGDGASC
ncbi:PAAR motif protein [Variibacter gotjawalensis]|uniref:PAAR motif protein n=1 Tax=Variibacter gotjawalensis TaxID=1333996 RepID=A0A0S3PVF5_9BRAD|nr:PAAR domain-containing protein [Variibacter gotjawalensis]NIK45696.1 putative Zn-binding protein involved in type VI secretion [Variibacter gotjawalensis]RZS47623.1 putative Zn-binding protein involved in type VI secretion [Variibacter gotjawalensis]BAT59875.1 PAAR motif protein [Variibacter gotjawalensis]